ncbi:MAG: hypothetical protein ABL963_11245 [Longimicrobiales bacterium]
MSVLTLLSPVALLVGLVLAVAYARRQFRPQRRDERDLRVHLMDAQGRLPPTRPGDRPRGDRRPGDPRRGGGGPNAGRDGAPNGNGDD